MKLYTVNEVKQKESEALKKGLSAHELIHQVGSLAAEEIFNFANTFEPGHIKRFVLLCGTGNNGADGLAIAHALFEADAHVVVYLISPKNKLHEQATLFLKELPKEIPVFSNGKLKEQDLKNEDCIIDCLLGSGVQGELEPLYQKWIELINESDAPVVSIDLPSGLNADTGECTCCVRADLTLVPHWFKRGHVLGHGAERCGMLRQLILDIDLEDNFSLFTAFEARLLLPRLARNTYKKVQGVVSILAGSKKYAGAAALCAESALRVGAGIVRLHTSESASFSRLPNALILDHLASDKQGFIQVEKIDFCDANTLVMGPGLGETLSLKKLVETCLKKNPKETIFVIDASALSMITPSQIKGKKVILTPHIGEAKTLAKQVKMNLPKDVNDTASRIAFAQKLAQAYKATVVLKGNRTICASALGEVIINSSGTPALATAGSGDVLAGIIGGFAPIYGDFIAAVLGVYIHGYLAEISPQSMRGTIADDLVELLPLALKKISPFA